MKLLILAGAVSGSCILIGLWVLFDLNRILGQLWDYEHEREL